MAKLSNKTKPSENDSSSIDFVEAHKYHSTEAARALQGIVETIIESGVVSYTTVERLLDHIHNVDQTYKELALYIASEEEFPDRAARWPGFFESGKRSTEESEDSLEVGG